MNHEKNSQKDKGFISWSILRPRGYYRHDYCNGKQAVPEYEQISMFQTGNEKAIRISTILIMN